MARSIPIVVALVLLLGPGTAQAHASLVRSTPAAGATVATAPAELVLEFSEALDPAFSSVHVLDDQNARVNPGPGMVDPSAPTILRLALDPLPEQSYSAVYRVRSAVDGHITEGALPFGVGVAAIGSLIPAADSPDPATLPPPVGDSVLRWLNLLVVVTALGSLPFAVLVWRPALRAIGRDEPEVLAADVAMTTVLRRLLAIGSGALLVVTLVFAVNQAAIAADRAFSQALGEPVLQLLIGRSGQLLLLRMALALVLLAAAMRLPNVGSGASWPWFTALAIGAVLLATFSLFGHTAALAQNAPLALPLIWLHLAAVVVWVGGLAPLAAAVLVARRVPRLALLSKVVTRFSRLAMVCVGLLAMTGIYQYMLQVGNLDLLATTTYGRALAVKISLFAVLIAFGAVNARVLIPRLRAFGTRFIPAFRRSVMLEAGVAALLLLAVGVMASVAPSRVAWEAHERRGIAEHATVDDVDLTLRVAPARIGDNEFALDVADRRPGAADQPTRVLLRFGMTGMEMSGMQTEMNLGTTQRYVARGSYISMGGRWQMTVIFRRAGFSDVEHTFEVDVLRPSLDAE
jgi:copper transport protein